jgi:glycosyltransferase involved in cell wall biosynthesis
MMVPLYLPMFVDDRGDIPEAPVFFGGVNVYLQQKFGIFRKTPRWLDKILDSKWLLRQAAQQEGTTDPAGLGPMTLSMLDGPSGHQAKELERFVAWMKEHERPDVIHISNALLLGLAPTLRAELPGVKIVCSLQDEEGWLDSIAPPYSESCWRRIAELGRDIDAFISVSEWYAAEIQSRLGVPRDKFRVVLLGVELEAVGNGRPPAAPPVLGYLSKMCPLLGLGTLVEVFIRLKTVPGLESLKLRATGGQNGGDRQYVASLKKRLAQNGLDQDAEFLEAFDLPTRRAFLESLSVLSVPAEKGEAAGMFILEALVSSVPVVQPSAGGFPEFVNATGGGLLYDPAQPDALFESLKQLLLDPERARELGRNGNAAVRDRFGIDRMAQDMIKVYTEL